MQTLRLKSNSKKDLALLLNLAKEKGLTLEVVPRTGLNKVVETKPSKQQIIKELSKEVNKAMHEKLMKQYNLYNDSNNR